MSMVRGYIALCMGKRRADAGLEIQEHILNGGTMDDATKVMQEEMEQSDFFRNLNKRAEAEATKNQEKKNTGGRKTAAAK